ncbi:hypothetical protein ABW19_dt0200401 [Dactylella cylindrospora]|nr:hypothetical protein ABW19_dt0200401 [Dactylella cylindrospora]
MTYDNYPHHQFSSSSATNFRKGAHRKSSSTSSHPGGAVQTYYSSPSSPASHSSFTSSNANPRTLPYISIQRTEAASSPATVATTISSHSTPSPSPSRPTTMPGIASTADFSLFDDISSSMAENPSAMNSYASGSFPIIVPHDAHYSSYGQPYGGYSSGGYADASSTLYGLSQDQEAQRQSQITSKYLRPSFPNLNGGNRQRTAAIQQAINADPISPSKSGRSPTEASNPRNSGYSTGSTNCEEDNLSINKWLDEYLRNHSDLKLGRTFSDVAQDELYNPEPAMRLPQGKTHNGSFQAPEIKSESKTAFPRIFSEAQEKHRQDFSRNVQQQSDTRQRSPFRHNSPFHPTNSPHLPQGIDQNQLALALALREQINEAERTAPKTISPREALLEYHEPESQHGQVTLFPPLTGTHDDVASNNGSLHASSHDGSDMGDFQSMATSRRESMANSVSSHLDVPRFGYMQQASFDPIGSNTYYYTDSSLGNSIQMSENTVPYIKEELGGSIPRPLDTSANTGTYTCTYSGCGQRFTTSTKLQKHRREAHRKSVPSGNSVSSAAAIAARNAQPGPHRCMRVNPSTGKPCNTIFSRPYDLTRHEDTIHNTAKAKVRCEICDDDKFFSRSDALVRHRRVKHGIH